MKILRRLCVFFVLLGILVGGAALYLSEKYVVPIIMYHHISPGTLVETDRVSPENFRIQMNYLLRHHYNVIPFDEFVKGMKAGKKFSYKTVVITFDDGYEDNFTYAFPVLQQLKLPAIMFICPGFAGKKGFMNWDQIKTIQAGGVVSFGSHTMTHTYLPMVSREQQEYEILESKRILEQELG
ncbi:MAG: polysaccharide deacetylase family protein, partial [Candidatus Omnitrophica bacterium]|nr:polysaccharide deacetylase family protein [Candidatus Omnitrophota bacterium]